MIVSKTPLRISFFGGGTDYEVWFKEHKGAVLATSIDKYIYMTCRHLPPFFEHKSRIVWSLIELVKKPSEIKHPSVRESLRLLKIKEGVEIHYDADLPAKTGLGSSSAFTVGLLHALYALKGKIVDPTRLSKEAVYVEQQMIRENVGCQDQILAAFGGFNIIHFLPGKEFIVQPVTINREKLRVLQDHLMLLFTGFSRTASRIVAEQIKQTPKKQEELEAMYQLVFEAVKILNNSGPVAEFGKLLHETWKLKRSLTSKISTPEIDEIYSAARKAGALGGKLLGAGGGGFMLLFAEPGAQLRIRSKLRRFLHVPFQFEDSGSRIIINTPS